jgi:hypothetical protein
MLDATVQPVKTKLCPHLTLAGPLSSSQRGRLLHMEEELYDNAHGILTTIDLHPLSDNKNNASSSSSTTILVLQYGSHSHHGSPLPRRPAPPFHCGWFQFSDFSNVVSACPHYH